MQPSYVAILRTPHARPLVLASLIGRLSSGTGPLALVLFVQDAVLIDLAWGERHQLNPGRDQRAAVHVDHRLEVRRLRAEPGGGAPEERVVVAPGTHDTASAVAAVATAGALLSVALAAGALALQSDTTNSTAADAVTILNVEPGG